LPYLRAPHPRREARVKVFDMKARCHECGKAPARVHLKDITLCGVCYHQAIVYKMVKERI